MPTNFTYLRHDPFYKPGSRTPLMAQDPRRSIDFWKWAEIIPEPIGSSSEPFDLRMTSDDPVPGLMQDPQLTKRDLMLAMLSDPENTSEENERLSKAFLRRWYRTMSHRP